MVLRSGLFILAYFITGKLGLLLAATGGGYAAPVWAPAGLSFAAVMFWGWRALPGVWFGAFLTNISIAVSAGDLGAKSALVATCVASGNLLEAAVARLLLTKAFSFSKSLERTTDVFSYIATSILAPAASALIGANTLRIAGNLHGVSFAETMVTWWIGNSVGAALLAPLLFSVLGRRRTEEAGSVQVLPYVLVASTLFVLLLDLGSAYPFQPILGATLIFATLIICSVRLPLWRLSWVILAISVAAIYRSYFGYGIHALIQDRVHRMLLMQFLLGSATITAMTLNAAINEKLRALEQAHQRELSLLNAIRTAAIGEMAAGIAHEINNPLSVLSSRAQLLLSAVRSGKFDTAEIQSSGEKIMAMTERITKIVRSLYFFSRKTENDPFEDASIRKIVEETVELCAKHFKDAGVRLEIEPISKDLRVSCRPVEVGQMILNLLSNAVAAVKSPDPSEHLKSWVRLAARRSGANLELSVTDSGDGIPDDVRGRIFDPFFTTKAPGQGTGLGLSLSREIALKHGGALFLDENSVNTRFVARLPLKEA